MTDLGEGLRELAAEFRESAKYWGKSSLTDDLEEAHIETVKAELIDDTLTRLEAAERQRNDMIAVLNRDGRHHHAKVGTEQAIEDGLNRFHQRGLRAEAAEAVVEATRKPEGMYREIAIKNARAAYDKVKAMEAGDG